MKMRCSQCGKDQEICLIPDTRGIPEARCSVCKKLAKKMSTREVIEYYEEKIANPEPTEPTEDLNDGRPPCKYCTENYFMRQGRLGTIYKPIEIKFCPMCARRIRKSDRDY